MKIKILFIACILSLFMFPIALAASGTFVWDYVQANLGNDSVLDQSDPVNPNPNSQLIACGQQGTSNQEYISLLDFSYIRTDGNISASTIIDNITLEVQVRLKNEPDFSTMRWYPLFNTTSWTEAGATWNNVGKTNMTSYNGTRDLLLNRTIINPAVGDRINVFMPSYFAKGYFSGINGSNGIIVICNSTAFTTQVYLESSDSIAAGTPLYRVFVGWDNASTPSDNTPPGITNYNLISEGGAGCANWNTNKNNVCETSDSTPTINITTNENADCRIGLSDFNFTDMGTSRNCTGSSGVLHTCTLIPADEIIEDTKYIYVGCKDVAVSSNENRTSTSGALRVSLLNREANARMAIESGIQHALGSGYTLYTDQKVYARNSANQQSIGIFDKVVKWMNKIWAFNFITGNDTSTTMFNITPVLYVLEMSNITNTTVNTTVYNFIQSTR